MIIFNLRYFLIALVLLIGEIIIALYVRDSFIRPYGGDFLVVILLYCSVRAFLKSSPLRVSIGVLLFSYLIETLQYFRIVDRLGLAKNTVAKTVIGYGFEWLDILAYTLGIITVLALEHFSFRGTRNVNA